MIITDKELLDNSEVIAYQDGTMSIQLNNNNKDNQTDEENDPDGKETESGESST